MVVSPCVDVLLLRNKTFLDGPPCESAELLKVVADNKTNVLENVGTDAKNESIVSPIDSHGSAGDAPLGNDADMGESEARPKNTPDGSPKPDVDIAKIDLIVDGASKNDGPAVLVVEASRNHTDHHDINRSKK